VDNGFGPQLLCTLVAFRDEQERRLALIYLYKRGSFYPFAPLSGERRDNALELQIKGVIGSDLKWEQDLARWFPVWAPPVCERFVSHASAVAGMRSQRISLDCRLEQRHGR